MERERLVDRAGRKTIIDLSGDRFGRVVARELVTDQLVLAGIKSSIKGSIWLCDCDCGGQKMISGRSLVRGNTRSCGCLELEVKSKMGKQRAGYNKKADTALRKLFRNYRYSAEGRKIDFDIEMSVFAEITQKDCCYCGAKPSSEISTPYNKSPYIYNGIDRVDSGQGYIKDNCVPCCKSCNFAKHNMTEVAFATWVCRVAEHWAKDKLTQELKNSNQRTATSCC